MLSAALAACGAPPPADTAATPAPEPEPQRAAPAPQPAPEPEPQKEQDTARLPREAQPIAPPARVTPVPIAQHLMGRDHAGVTAVLGRPNFERKEPPAEIWQYRGERCILDIFFMPRGGALRVAHVAIRGYGVAKVEESDCLADLAGNLPEAEKG